MFLESSRYFRQKLVDVVKPDGQTIRAVSLRRLPNVSGNPVTLKGSDQLDILAQQQYQNPTWFWHIADANSELEANQLVKPPFKVINVPEQ